MSQRDTPWTPGTPCWVDLVSPDRDAAADFYRSLFGWDLTDHGPDMGDYMTAAVGGRAVAGIGPMQPGMERSVWTTYLASADVDASTSAAAQAGGTVVLPPGDLSDQGRMSIVADPTGAVFGIWQSGQNHGIQLANEPGALTWNECMTRDFAADQAFYGSVFGYDWLDMSGDGFTYAAFMIDGGPVGGLGVLTDDMPADLPAHWVTYFKVADAGESATKVVELGGTVVREPWDTPFGTMAMVTDLAGATFSIMADNEQSIANAQAQNQS